jgi:hypothetical protein
MTKPDAGQSNWAGLMNANLDILDAKFPGGVAGITSIGLSLPAELSITGSPLTANGTITGSWVSQAANKVFAAPSGGAGTPAFRLLVASDIPALAYASSVGLSLPAEITVSNSPVTGSGTLTGVWASQAANKVLAAPSGGAGTPAFRLLAASDIPALAYVTSVGITVPSWYSVSGSPVTGSGTLAISAASGQTQNQFLATPNGGSGAVGLRSIVAADIPSLSATYLSLSAGGTVAGATTFTNPIIVQDAFGATRLTLISSANASTGLYLNGAVIGLVSQTAGWVGIGNTAATCFQLPLQGMIGFSSSASVGAAANQTWIGQDGARIVRIGNAAGASPVANTLQIGESSRGGTDSNVSGTDGVIRSGDGTGNSALSKLLVKTPLLGASGTTAQVYANREVLMHTKTGLTNNTATAIAQVALPSASMGSAQICYTVEVSDGTDFQTETGMVSFASVNKAGTLTHGTPAKSGNVQVVSAGTLAVTFTAVTNGSAVDLKATSNSSLTPTTHRISMSILNLSFTNDVTPQ